MSKLNSPREPDPSESLPLTSKEFTRRFGVLSLILLLLVALFFTPISIVTAQQNGEFLVASYKFYEDDFDNLRLKLLRKREHLDQVVASGDTEFDKIILLRHWAHAQWKSQAQFYYPPWDAVEILDLVRKHHNYGFCAQYAIVFLQACQAMGIHARYVELNEHFIVGVWSNEYNMWVVMDPTQDLYFERNGKPVGGGDLCRAYWAKKTEGLLSVAFDGTRKPITLDELAPYKLYSIVKTADQLSHPVGVRVNGSPLRPLTIESDYTRYPLIGRDHLAIGSMYLVWKPDGHPEFFSDKPMTDDRDDFRYKENQAMMFVARVNAARGLAKIVLRAENAPVPGSFLYSVNGSSWQPTNVEQVVWSLRPGLNQFSARVLTAFGWKGPVSTVSIYYKPTRRFLVWS